MSKAGGQAAKRFGDDVLNRKCRDVTGVSSARRADGSILSKAEAAGKAARRSGAGVLSKAVAEGLSLIHI